ncbi:hypothetical protein TIFTF001_031340 [Ficus carica]|uniref:Uncharacterized protein n=1 Tax=Ficus carica TaxID=3494 RepID=A0AA88J670_FICCA|nr:hypothetical protein TIFTF001_031340 [Ficus carica]
MWNAAASNESSEELEEVPEVSKLFIIFIDFVPNSPEKLRSSLQVSIFNNGDLLTLSSDFVFASRSCAISILFSGSNFRPDFSPYSKAFSDLKEATVKSLGHSVA